MGIVADLVCVIPGFAAITRDGHDDGRACEAFQRTVRFEAGPGKDDGPIGSHSNPFLVIEELVRISEMDHDGRSPVQATIVGDADGDATCGAALAEVAVET